MSELLTMSPPPTAKKKILLEDFEYKKDMTSGVMYTAWQNFQKISPPPTKKNQLLPEKKDNLKKNSGFLYTACQS